MQLAEKYRPNSFDEVAGHQEVIERLKRIIAKGLGGTCIWFSGKPGIGKTTLARILAAKHSDVGIYEYCAIDLTTDKLQYIRYELFPHPCVTKRRGVSIIVNEADRLSHPAVQKLLGMLEPVPEHVLFIFTERTERIARRDQPKRNGLRRKDLDLITLKSRCCTIPLSDQGLSEAFLPRLNQIRSAEGLTGHGEGDCKEILIRYRQDLRACLNEMGTWSPSQFVGTQAV